MIHPEDTAADDPTFGEYLRDLRVAAGLTQIQAGAAFNLGQPAVSAYEVGRAYPPGHVVLVMARLYNVGIEELLQRMAHDRNLRKSTAVA